LASKWSKLGIHTTLLCPLDYVSKTVAFEFDRELPFSVIRFEIVPLLFKIPFRVYKAFKIAWDSKCTVLVASAYRSGLYALLPQFILNIPRINIGHGSEFGFKSSLPLQLSRLSFSSATHVIVVSQYTAKLAQGVLPHKRMTVIPNGGEPTRFYPGNRVEARKKLNLPQEAFLILTVGRMCTRKAQDLIIKAIHELPMLNPKIHYCLVGHPEGRDKLENLGRELGLSDRLHFHSQAPFEDIPLFYQSANLYALPSRVSPDGDHEGFGISIIEAALCACPALSTRNSGTAEALEENKTGWLVEPENSKALAQILLTLHTQPDLLREAGNAAYQRAQKDYTWEKVADKYREVMGL